MNFYRRFPGDYARDTKHLTMLEHGAYNLLLAVLYSTEKPLPHNEALLFRVCSASTKREKRAIKYVLSEFFYEKPTGFSNARFEKELSIAASRINAARNNGSMGGRPHKTKPTDNPAHNPEHNPQESYPDSRRHKQHLFLLTLLVLKIKRLLAYLKVLWLRLRLHGHQRLLAKIFPSLKN